MLVLSRKVDQAIQIGDDIQIVITKITPNRVSIGVTAPADVPVMRSELFEKQRVAAIESELEEEFQREPRQTLKLAKYRESFSVEALGRTAPR